MKNHRTNCFEETESGNREALESNNKKTQNNPTKKFVDRDNIKGGRTL
jgi:hypothetical protein